MIIYADEDAAGAIEKFKKKGNLTGQFKEISEKDFHFHWNSFHYVNKKKRNAQSKHKFDPDYPF